MLVLPGIALVVGVTPSDMNIGIAVAVLSALLVALFPAAPQTFAIPSQANMKYLLLLAFACTSLPFALSLRVFRHLSGFASGLAVNLEPVYAIILAIFILGEQQELNVTFYLGAGLILCVVFIYPSQRQNVATRKWAIARTAIIKA